MRAVFVPVNRVLAVHMGTKFRVRLKTRVKLQIIGSLFAIAASITFIGLYVFDMKFAETEYKYFFETDINRVLGTDGQMFYGGVTYKGRSHRVRSITRLRLNQNVCIGVVEHILPFKINSYIVVDDDKCS
jgi:hypothetical protein